MNLCRRVDRGHRSHGCQNAHCRQRPQEKPHSLNFGAAAPELENGTEPCRAPRSRFGRPEGQGNEGESGWGDLNSRPLGPEPSALATAPQPVATSADS